MTVSFDDFKQQLTGCLHVEAAQAVLEEIDAIYDIYPDREFQGLIYSSLGEIYKLL